MKTLREADVQPLDLLLFRGVDPVSTAIRFVERGLIGRGDFSHAGLAVTREVLDLPCLEPGKVYVWESTLSASQGFWARFTDRIPSAETTEVRFGVQLRDLELLIPGYGADGGQVSSCAFQGERPPLDQVRRELLALHAEYGHAPYTANLLSVFGVVFPELRSARDGVNRLQDRVADVVNRLFESADKEKRVEDADHHVFCSEWVARIYKRLGILDLPDPRLAAPVHFLTRTNLFLEPVRLVPEDSEAQIVAARRTLARSRRGESAAELRARAAGASFLRHHALQERVREFAEARTESISLSDDGRIAIEFGDASPEDASDVERCLAEDTGLDLRRPRAPVDIESKPPPLAIAMLVTGTQADVQPFVAVGRRLKRDGHRVRLATHAALRDFVESNDLEFYPLGGEPAEVTAYVVRTKAERVRIQGDRSVEDLPAKQRMLGEIIESTWRACTQRDPDRPDAEPFIAEAIISSPLTYGHAHVAEALQVPLQILFATPWSPTQEFPHPIADLDFGRRAVPENVLSYGVVEGLAWAGTADLITRFREKTLGLPKLPAREGPGLLHDATVPFCYLWSPSLAPPPPDWGQHIDVADFVFPEEESGYEPPAELAAFFEEGDPPIYVGLEAAAGEDAEALLETIFRALEAARQRGVVAVGGCGPAGAAPPETVRLVDACPLDWLFPRCAAVCHHGGVGPTSIGLRAGRPTIVVPVAGAQPFWAAMIERAGVGPEPIRMRTLTVERLAEAFRACQDPTLRTRAAELGETLRSRDGAELVVRSFYDRLPATADGLMVHLGFGGPERKRVLAGEIVTKKIHEGSSRRLGLAVIAKVDQPLDELYEACLSGRPLELDPRIETFHALGDRDAEPADFETAGYGPADSNEVAALLQARADGPFNLSARELERFQELGRQFPEKTPSPDAIAAVNRALREHLLERHRAYRAGGLAAVAPYVRGGGAETRPDEVLRVAIAPDTLLREEFPDFYRALLDYPKHSEDFESRFYWGVQRIEGHPAFTLAHHLHLVGNGFAGLSARTFYVGRGFDAQQILLGMLPHDHATLLFSVHRSLGEKIGGIRQALRRPRLHAQVEQAVIQVVESFRSGAALAG